MSQYLNCNEVSCYDSMFKVFWKFLQRAKFLQHLRDETLEAIEDIGRSGNLSEDQLNDLRFSAVEVDELNKVFQVSPCVIIMGQDTYGKLAMATLLLGKQILPMAELQHLSGLTDFCNPIQFSYPNAKRVHEQSYRFVGSDFRYVSILLESLSLEDISLSEEEAEGPHLKIIDVEVAHPLLRDGLQIIIAPTYPQNLSGSEKHFIDLCMSNVLPIILYAITKSSFSELQTLMLQHLKESYPDSPVLFVEVPTLPLSFSSDLTESEQHDALCRLGIMRQYSTEGTRKEPDKVSSIGGSSPYHCVSEQLMHTLCDKLGYLQPEIPPQSLSQRVIDEELQVYSDYVSDLSSFSKIRNFLYLVLHGELIKAATILHSRLSRCMRMIILYAFDVAREIQITPKRINYAKEKENELYEALIDIASKKQDEIREFILDSIAEMTENVSEIISKHKFKAIDKPSETEVSTHEVRLCTLEIQELIMTILSESVGRQLATRLNIMRESYLGTLQRCLENLENDCRVCGESPNIGEALKQMLNAAYQVEVTTSTSYLRTFWEKMKRLVTSMPGRTPPVIDSEWKQKVALDTLTSLSESKLAKNICAQFRDRIKMSHDSFVVSMKQLESQLACKLEQKEENHLRIKNVDAPRLARVSLESTSLRDRILYGMPHLEKEIGRGQYGVVFGCKSWARHEPCAIKSLVPLDDRHWNDLSMEFHYTRSVPEHDHIVALRGSVIDYSYAQGDTPAVLLVMDRLNRDLYSGLKAGLEWKVRMQISLDVTKGIRFLHSQGLVHRDIKLKNVLLDPNCRAKLTDLGFCKPEAMMSGSVVGTPIHMAPELFTGHYDNSVDVYAFGILFWYICSGQVKLPLAFEQCHSKDHLWNCVRKGGRPERLPSFTDDCWNLMNECWAADPTARPFLGNVEPQLEKIMADAATSITDLDHRLASEDQRRRKENFELDSPLSLLE